MFKHGVYVSEQATSIGTPVVAGSGIPFVVGAAPVNRADNPAKAGIPVLCTSWAEAVDKLGFSENWKDYTLCEFMYSHFRLFQCQPVVFMNVLDVEKMADKVADAAATAADHKITLTGDAIVSSLKVEVEVPAAVTEEVGAGEDAASGDGADLDEETEGGSVSGGDEVGNDTVKVTLVKGTDYDAYYDGESLIVELLSESAYYDKTAFIVSYSKVNASKITLADIASGIEGIELCLSALGMIPDLICAPGYSHNSVIAAAMSAKADNVSGLFKAKAIIDIDSSVAGARSYDAVYQAKIDANLVSPNEIICWPCVKLGDYLFHMSTQLAGLMAQVDSGNDGCPYESPSNKNLQMDGACLEDGTEVMLTHSQANILNGNGICTALNFMGGWVAWGNNTACYPTNTDVKDYQISLARMFAWVGNTLVQTFWSRLDKPMNRRLIDTIINSANIWLDGLAGSGYLLGARVEMLDEENPLTALMQGIIKLHIYMTPPSAAQEIDFVLEYDPQYVTAALTE